MKKSEHKSLPQPSNSVPGKATSLLSGIYRGHGVLGPVRTKAQIEPVLLAEILATKLHKNKNRNSLLAGTLMWFFEDMIMEKHFTLHIFHSI